MPILQSEDEVDARIGDLEDCCSCGDFDGSMRCIADLTTYFVVLDSVYWSREMTKRNGGLRNYYSLLNIVQRP